jgi:hypothetical protein
MEVEHGVRIIRALRPTSYGLKVANEGLVWHSSASLLKLFFIFSSMSSLIDEAELFFTPFGKTAFQLEKKE